MTPIIIFLTIALLAGGYWWRSRRQPSRDAPPPTVREAKRFAAVEIRSRGLVCGAARTLQGQRFLSHQAPALPLVGCDIARCGCSFAKLSDRREDERRSEYPGLTTSMFRTAERREQTDRRDAD